MALFEDWEAHSDNDHLRFEVEVGFRTEDGRFDELFRLPLEVRSLEWARTYWEVSGAELSGSYTAPEALRNAPQDPNVSMQEGPTARDGSVLAVLRFERSDSEVACRGSLLQLDQNEESAIFDAVLRPYAAW